MPSYPTEACFNYTVCGPVKHFLIIEGQVPCEQKLTIENRNCIITGHMKGKIFYDISASEIMHKRDSYPLSNSLLQHTENNSVIHQLLELKPSSYF
jgi:hypothetical protein